MIPGIDLASYQGAPSSWSQIAGDYEWAAVKLTELSAAGSYVNPVAGADWAYLKANRKGRVAYLFGHPAASPAAAVDLFGSVLAGLGLADGDGICLDLEVTDGRPPHEVDAWAAAVLAALAREHQRVPLVYTFLSFAQDGNCASLGGYPLWIADPSSPEGHPRIPPPWTAWDLHQYKTTPLDRDVARYPGLAAMRAAIGRTPPPPGHLIQEDPMLLAAHGIALPVAIPDGTRAIRFAASAAASVTVQFHTEARPRTAALSWAGGSHAEAVPDKCHAALISRTDTGPGGVAFCFTT